LGRERQINQRRIKSPLGHASESIEQPMPTLLFRRQMMKISDQSPGQQTR